MQKTGSQELDPLARAATALLEFSFEELEAFLRPISLSEIRRLVRQSDAGRTLQRHELSGFRPDKVPRDRALRAFHRAFASPRGPILAQTILEMWELNAGVRRLRDDVVPDRTLFAGGPVPALFLERSAVVLDPECIGALRKLIQEETPKADPVDLNLHEAGTSASELPEHRLDHQEKPEADDTFLRFYGNPIERDQSTVGSTNDVVTGRPAVPRSTIPTALAGYARKRAEWAETEGLWAEARAYWAARALRAVEMRDASMLDETVPRLVLAGVRADGEETPDVGDVDSLVQGVLTSGSPVARRSVVMSLLLVAQADPESVIERLGVRSRSLLATQVPELFPQLTKVFRESKGKEPAVALVARRLGQVLHDVSRAGASLLERTTFEELRRTRPTIVSALKSIEPFMPSSEARTLDRLVRLLTQSLGEYEKAGPADEDRTYEAFRDQATEALGDSRANDGFFEATILTTLLTASRQAVEVHQLGRATGRAPLVKCNIVKPANVTDGVWIFETELSNAGNGVASVLSLTWDPGEWIEISPSSASLDSLAPLETRVYRWNLLPIDGDTVDVTLGLRIDYLNRRSPGEVLLSIHVPRGRIADFSRFESESPYTIQSISLPERLKGRTEQLRRLREGFRRRASFMVTGQRRVGKTSLVRVFFAELDSVDMTLGVHIPLGEIQAASDEPDLGRLGKDLVDRIIEGFELAFGEKCVVDPPTLVEFRDSFNASFTGFVRRFDRAYRGMRLAIAIDDFDELPTPMFTGSTGRQLFLALRALMDKGTTFLFVGSERLPTLMAEQAQRLNQVDLLPVDYLDAQSLDALVRDPTAGTLDFTPGAVQQIAGWSARNPYFATILAAAVFDQAQSAGDASISEYDVEKAVSDVVENSPRSFYQHFWADSPRVRDEDRNLEETKASIAVLALSHLQSEPFQYVDRGVAAKNTAGLSAHEATDEISTLLERAVLEVSPDDRRLVRFRVPLFAAWLRRHAGVEFRQEQALAAQVTRMRPRDELELEEVLEVADGLFYTGESISTDDVRGWAKQFGALDDQRLMLRLVAGVKRLGLYREAAFINALTTIDQLVGSAASGRGVPEVIDRRRRSENYFVTHVDESGKSGSSTVVSYRRHNRLYEKHAGSPDKIVPLLRDAPGRSILTCVDDFVGTGASATAGLADLLARLDREYANWEQSVVVIFATVVGFESGIDRVSTHFSERVEVICPKRLDDADRAFHESGELFATADDRLRARSVAEKYGTMLDRRQPLGYENSEALVVFPDTVPNNTLPILWKTGTIGDRPWIPLFRARV